MIPNLPGVNHPSRWMVHKSSEEESPGRLGGEGGPGVICDTKGARVKGKV